MIAEVRQIMDLVSAGFVWDFDLGAVRGNNFDADARCWHESQPADVQSAGQNLDTIYYPRFGWCATRRNEPAPWSGWAIIFAGSVTWRRLNSRSSHTGG
jgi:hypothetical protein